MVVDDLERRWVEAPRDRLEAGDERVELPMRRDARVQGAVDVAADVVLADLDARRLGNEASGDDAVAQRLAHALAPALLEHDVLAVRHSPHRARHRIRDRAT